MSRDAFDQESLLTAPLSVPASFLKLTRPQFKEYQPLALNNWRAENGSNMPHDASYMTRPTAELGSELTDLLRLVAARPGAIPTYTGYTRPHEQRQPTSAPPIVPAAVRAPPIESTNLSLSMSTVPVISPQFLKFKAMSPKRVTTSRKHKKDKEKTDDKQLQALAELEERIRQLEKDRAAISLQYDEKLQQEKKTLLSPPLTHDPADVKAMPNASPAVEFTTPQREELKLMSQHAWNPQAFWQRIESHTTRPQSLSPTPGAEEVVLSSKGVTPSINHDSHYHLKKQYLISDELSSLAFSITMENSPNQLQQLYEQRLAPQIDARTHKSRIPRFDNLQSNEAPAALEPGPLYAQPVIPSTTQPSVQIDLSAVSLALPQEDTYLFPKPTTAISLPNSPGSIISSSKQHKAKSKKRKTTNSPKKRAVTPSVDALMDAQESLEQMYRKKLHPAAVPVCTSFAQIKQQDSPQVITHLKKDITPRLLDSMAACDRLIPFQTPEHDPKMAKTLTQRHEFVPIISSTLLSDGDAIQMKPADKEALQENRKTTKAATAFSVLGSSGLIAPSTHTQFLAKSILDRNVLANSTCTLAERSISQSELRDDFLVLQTTTEKIPYLEDALTDSAINITKDGSLTFSEAVTHTDINQKRHTKILTRRQPVASHQSMQGRVRVSSTKARGRSHVMFAGIEMSEMSNTLSSSPSVHREQIESSSQQKITAHMKRLITPAPTNFEKHVALSDPLIGSISEASKMDDQDQLSVLHSFNTHLTTDDIGMQSYMLLKGSQ